MTRIMALLLLGALLAGCTDNGDPPGTGTATPTTSAASLPSPASTSTSTSSGYPDYPAWTPGSWTKVPCADQPGSALAYPGLVAIDAGQLVVLVWDNATASYVVEARGPPGRGTRIVEPVTGGFYVDEATENGSRIVHYDSSLQELHGVDSAAVGSMRHAQGTLYVGTPSSFAAYSPGLVELDRYFPANITIWGPKTIDDIQVVDGIAYVLDDVVHPYYAFRVDVHDPTNLIDLGTERIDVVGGIGPQWIDSGRGIWHIGWYELSTHPPSSRGAFTAAYQDGERVDGVELRVRNAWESKNTGYDLSASTSGMPAWALIQNETHRLLANIDFQGSQINHSCGVAIASTTHNFHSVHDLGAMLIVHSGLDVYLVQPGASTPAHHQTLPFLATQLKPIQ